MVKTKLLTIGFCLIMINCIPIRNEYNNVRFKLNRFRIKPNINEAVHKIIDTSAFYQKININNTANNIKNQGIKFYKKGEIGFFKNVNFNNINTLNPKHAKMGYYNYSLQDFIIESIFSTPGGKHYLSLEKIVNIKGDTLFVKTIKTPRGGGYITTYVKKNLPNEFLVYKPDW